MVSLHKKPLNLIVMSLFDWLLAAFVYEKFFDDDPKEHPNRSTFDDDSFRDYDYDDFDDF